jgi:hypothetical protein
MPSRKKNYVLLRGKLSGKLIVGKRVWYEHERIAKSGLWKQLHQSDDYDVLLTMAELGNQPDAPLNNDIDKWFDTKRR